MRFWGVVLVAFAASAMWAQKPTPVAQAKAAVEANMKSAEGQKYDTDVGTAFGDQSADDVAQCFDKSGGDTRPFVMYMKLGEAGEVQEILLDPKTKVGSCVRERVVKERFPRPPRAMYWVKVEMKFAAK